MRQLKTITCVFGIFSFVTGLSLNNVTEHYHRLQGSNYVTEVVRNFQQCQGLCNQRSLCKSVNYEPKTRKCTSNYHDTVTSPIPLVSTDPGTVFVEKRTFCTNTDCIACRCEDNEICVLMGSQTRCLTEEIDCDDPPDIPNAVYSVDGTSLNSHTNYSCEEGYISYNNSVMTSVCDVTRKWTSITLTCVDLCLLALPTDCYLFCSQTGTTMYAGNKSTTETGITCQRWDAQSPHDHNHQDASAFPDDTVSAAENFCRDPDKDGYPWCYTVDPDERWMSCGVPPCT